MVFLFGSTNNNRWLRLHYASQFKINSVRSLHNKYIKYARKKRVPDGYRRRLYGRYMALKDFRENNIASRVI